MSLVMTNIQPHEYLDALNEGRQLRTAAEKLLAELGPIVNELHNGFLNGVRPAGCKGDLKSLATELSAIAGPLREALARAGR